MAALRRNGAAAIGLLLGVGSVVGYFLMVALHDPRLSPWLRLPVLHLAVLASGLVLSILGVRAAWSHPPRRRGRVLAPILAGLNLAVAGLFCFFLFVATAWLPAAANAPAVGQTAPPFELPDQNGRSVSLESLRGRNLVLVFYRGFW